MAGKGGSESWHSVEGLHGLCSIPYHPTFTSSSTACNDQFICWRGAIFCICGARIWIRLLFRDGGDWQAGFEERMRFCVCEEVAAELENCCCEIFVLCRGSGRYSNSFDEEDWACGLMGADSRENPAEERCVIAWVV
jgi:hypothetical protein